MSDALWSSFQHATERHQREPTIADCLDIACRITGTPQTDVLSRRRGTGLRARMLAMWLARHRTRHSFPEIGRALERDHTTVMYGVERVEYLRSASVDWRELTDRALEAAA